MPGWSRVRRPSAVVPSPRRRFRRSRLSWMGMRLRLKRRFGGGERSRVRNRRASFLDRDGTIIRDTEYLRDPEQVELLPGAAQAIKRLNDAGWPVIVVGGESRGA